MAEKQPKREPLLKLSTAGKKLSSLEFVKQRAARRTKMRITMELEAKEMKRQELALARGEVSADELSEPSKDKIAK